MFEKLRKVGYDKKPSRVRSIFYFILFALICFVFVFMYMMPSQMGMDTNGNAATINGEIISLADFNNAFNQRYNRVSQFLEQMPEGQRQQMTDTMKRNVLNDLVNMEVGYQSLKDESLFATSKEVFDLISQQDYFKIDGEFSKAKYFQMLDGARIKPKNFEQNIAKDIVRQKAVNAVMASAIPSTIELQNNEKLKGFKLNVGYIKFNNDQLKAKMTLSNEEVTKFLSENEQKVKEKYENSKLRFKTQDEVRARHILVKIDPKDKDSDSKALKRINEAKERLKKGESFDAVVAEYSEDPGSKTKKGDLGFFTRGRMVKEFEDVAFTIELNKLSDPVKTAYGYHLIETLEKKTGKQKEYEEVKNQLAKEMLQDEKVLSERESLEKTIESGNTSEINQMLAKYGFSWDSTGEFSIETESIPKLGNNETVVTEALSVEKGQIAKKIVQSNGMSFIVRLDDLKTNESKSNESYAFKDYEQLASSRYMDIFSSWIEVKKKEVKLSVNQRLLM